MAQGGQTILGRPFALTQHAARAAPFTEYLEHFDELIGEKRTAETSGKTMRGIINIGSLVCQRIASTPASVSRQGWSSTGDPLGKGREHQALRARCNARGTGPLRARPGPSGRVRDRRTRGEADLTLLVVWALKEQRKIKHLSARSHPLPNFERSFLL
jgi:hypothetical protein